MTVSSYDWAVDVAGDSAAREALLVQHLGLVHHVARRLYRRDDTRVAYDELVSAGTLGLAAALDSFDASRRLAFSTYAIPRIRGSILDELRRLDHRSRTDRVKLRTIARGRRELTHALGREPSTTEQAAHLGVDRETLRQWRSAADARAHVSLDNPSSSDSAASVVGSLAVDTTAEIEHRIALEQEIAYLRDALLQLREPARVVLTMYYYEELKLKDIAAVLGVSESRVSQIRSRALATLRADLAPLRGPSV